MPKIVGTYGGDSLRPPFAVERRIDHKNLGRYLKRLQQEPEFQIEYRGKPRQGAWYRQPCYLVLALGELAEDGLKTMALTGMSEPEIIEIPKNARFNAQGLEGACRIRKPLFNALMNLRDLVPQYRGYVLTDRQVRQCRRS